MQCASGRYLREAPPIADATQASFKAPAAAAQVEIIIAAAVKIRDTRILLQQDNVKQWT